MKSAHAAVAVLAGLFAAGSAEASLEGLSFNASYRFPTIETPYGPASMTQASFAVGAGIEAIANVEDVTFVSIDFHATGLVLLLNTTLANPRWSSVPFNGLVFDLVSPGAMGIGGVSVDGQTTLAGFDASRVFLTDGRIAIDWNGLAYGDGTRVVIDFVATPVPEPGTYALMLAGLGAVGALGQRRRKGRGADA